MNNTVVYDKKIITLVQRILSRWGFSHREGLVYATLLLSKKPLSIEEITKITNLSRSSVSTSLSILTKEYMVNERKEGRIKLFTPIPAFYEKFLEQPEELLERELNPLLEKLEKMLKTVGDKEYDSKINSFINDLRLLKTLLRQIIEIERRT